MEFLINNYIWKVDFIEPNNIVFLRPDNTMTVGVTDNYEKTIYISNCLKGRFLYKVIYHELCHAFIFSFGIEIEEEQEEKLVQMLTEYSKDISNIADKIYDSLKKIAI